MKEARNLIFKKIVEMIKREIEARKELEAAKAAARAEAAERNRQCRRSQNISGSNASLRAKTCNLPPVKPRLTVRSTLRA